MGTTLKLKVWTSKDMILYVHCPSQVLVNGVTGL